MSHMEGAGGCCECSPGASKGADSGGVTDAVAWCSGVEKNARHKSNSIMEGAEMNAPVPHRQSDARRNEASQSVLC
ncbi:hypothetical protein GCM10009850_054780 [Nonomuraea monospora]|uniref:Uncharacterized protein n=1 Tax=Nonomuraea monospora TaxID=568818 RepID=A0ABP5PEJ2_9ACTN